MKQSGYVFVHALKSFYRAVSPGKLLLVAVGGLLVVFFFVPAVRDVFAPFFVVSTETITIPAPPSGDTGEAGEREVILVTLLGYDAIPSIMDPEFVNASQAELWMKPDEQVLGLSINGDHRAYSINMLSRHEIVNDVVGGLPVAVTW